MTPNRGRGRPRSEERRDAVLKAAMELMQEDDLRMASVDRISERSGVSKATINGGGARRVGIVGLAVLAAIALGADPIANAAPVPAPAPGGRAFLTDISAAGFGDSSGNQVALDQGLDICGLMDGGLSRQNMVRQFAAANPALGPGGAARVVGIATRDLCPWHG